MGQVYRARDARLDREVAIKVLPDAVAGDPERLARFEREAKTLAALNHPHIAHVYELADRALVMELVPGEDLSARISRGAIPLAEALPLARQIVEALAAAHDKGIVHRDLKPANVKITPDGDVKVLDFGLAKALAPDATVSGDPSNSPTLTAPATQIGMILGTAAYMAPEQARGRPVDARVDIWAFGAVLFEMLTGHRAFGGGDVSDVLASVLKSDPDWASLPRDLPPAIHRLLRRSLEKDARRRLSAIADARFDLDEAEAPVPSAAPSAVPGRPTWPAALALMRAAAVVGATATMLRRPAPAPAGAPTRTSVVVPQNLYPDSRQVAISPNGQMVAYIVGDPIEKKQSQLWVRRLDSLTATRLDDGDGASLPFWNPDSTRIGFFTDRKLKTIAATGGRADTVAAAAFGRGGTWNRADVIVFAGDAGGTLSRVSANGGEATTISALDATRKEVAHRFPAFLPDGDHFLYAALPGRNGAFNVFASSLSHPSQVTLVGAMASAPVYAPPGYLLFARQGALVAQRFDASALALAGEAVPLGDEPSVILDPQTSFTAGPVVSVSTTGAAAYVSAAAQKKKAVWLDATGRPAGDLAVKPDQYSSLRISPDGTQAVFVRSSSPVESMLWLADLTRASTTLIATGGGRNDSPIWSPDGTRVLFASDRDGAQNFFVKSVVDASPEQPLYRSEALFKTPTDWSGPANVIVFHQIDQDSAYNVYVLPVEPHAAPALAAGGPLREAGGHLSPDGRWLRYLSEDSGRYELIVQAYPRPGRRFQVSFNGAESAWWSRDGRQIVYTANNSRELWRVGLEPNADGLRVGTAVRIGTLPEGIPIGAIDATPDLQRFLALLPDRTGADSITVLQNWPSALAKR